MAAQGVSNAVRAISQFLVADVALGTTLERIAVLARDSITPAVACGLTMLDEGGQPATNVFTDQLSPEVDAGQYQDGAGPCLEAFRTSTLVRLHNINTSAERWPAFHRQAVAHGVISMLSVPMHAADECFGALNLYATNTRFEESDEDDAMLFATQASVVLANARAYWGAVDLASGLKQAIASRAVIEQAKGKIMATSMCSADEAFDMLVRASQRENIKLREVARRVIADLGDPVPT